MLSTLDLTQMLGVSLGAPGEGYAELEAALLGRGLRVSQRTLSSLRTNRGSRARTAFRLACADLLRANDASRKTAFCLRVAELGVHDRRYRARDPVFRCRGLSRGIGDALGCTVTQLSCCIRGMRVDVALWLADVGDEGLRYRFSTNAAHFLGMRAYMNPHRTQSVLRLIAKAWDHRTMEDFYRFLHRLGGPNACAAWFPYEVYTMADFYRRQMERGSPLTPLDRLLLQAAVRGSPTSAHIHQTMRETTGVDFTKVAVGFYRNLLVYGAPTPLPPPGP